MGRRNKPLIERVVIEDIAAEGKAIAYYNDCVVFAPYVIPGDVVDLQVTKKRKRYMEARVEKIHEYSADRLEPFCEHFGVCGGCKWQMLPYEKQIVITSYSIHYTKLYEFQRYYPYANAEYATCAQILLNTSYSLILLLMLKNLQD